MGSSYMVLARNRDDKAWLNYQSECFICTLIVLIKRRFTHEIVDIQFRNFKD